jgi:hypothetical protein
VLSRFCEIREELTLMFPSEESELAFLLIDETWCNKVAFLADIRSRKPKLTAVRIRCADHATPSIR